MRASRPYYPWPQDHSSYVHEVYPASCALVLDANGTTREATPEEQERIDEEYRAHLRIFTHRLI